MVLVDNLVSVSSDKDQSQQWWRKVKHLAVELVGVGDDENDVTPSIPYIYVLIIKEIKIQILIKII